MDKSNIQKERKKLNSNDDASLKSSLKNVDLTRKLEVMTYESTFNSWMTVGLGALVGGLYMARIIYLEDESILTYYAGLGGVFASIIVFSLSFMLFKKNMNRVKTKHAERSASMLLTEIISLLLIIGAILSLIFIMGS